MDDITDREDLENAMPDGATLQALLKEKHGIKLTRPECSAIIDEIVEYIEPEEDEAEEEEWEDPEGLDEDEGKEPDPT